MLAPLKWLKKYAAIDLPLEAFASKMIMAGLEVEDIQTQDKGMEQVVVGRIERIEPHPNADRLCVCFLNVGADEQLQICTGATNVFEGAYVPVALPGADLPNGVHIKPSKLRGVASNGMMCSGDELRLTNDIYPNAEDAEGILILQEAYPLGTPIARVLGLDDAIIDFKVTPNRVDWLSVNGMAREAAAVLGTAYTAPQTSYTAAGGDIREILSVEVAAPDLCTRYIARAIRKVKIAPSPKWMQQELKAAGMRPINNIVDITNYVLLEMGQPMHAFDYRQIRDHKIVVRRAEEGETLVTLDEKERVLHEDNLLITNPQDIMGIAGVMGGMGSSIAEDTTMVVFESACFNDVSIRTTSRSLGLRTEASARYEKGLEPGNCAVAMDRALHLVEELGAGEIVDGTIDLCAVDLTDRVLDIPASRVNALLGQQLSSQDMADLLSRLYIPTVVEGDTLHCQIPHFRPDLMHSADIAEEVQRIYGYDKIPSTPLPGSLERGGLTPMQRANLRLKELLCDLGLQEALTFSFMSPSQLERLHLEEGDCRRQAIRIKNPLGEDYSLMRTSLIPNLLQSLSNNLSRHSQPTRLFEVGKAFLPHALPLEELPDEAPLTAIGVAAPGYGFFELKGLLERVFGVFLHGKASYVAEGSPYYHPGRKAAAYYGDQLLAEFGQIHPDVAESFGLETPILAAEIRNDVLFSELDVPVTYQPLPRYPSSSRDLAVLVDAGQPVGPMLAAIERAGGALLAQADLFDVYQGKQVPEGKKSLAFSLEFRAEDHTLTDEEVQKPYEKIIRSLGAQFGASVRQ